MISFLIVICVACSPVIALLIMKERLRRRPPLVRLAAIGAAITWLVIGFISYALVEDATAERAAVAYLADQQLSYITMSRLFEKNNSGPGSPRKFMVHLRDDNVIIVVVAGDRLWGMSQPHITR